MLRRLPLLFAFGLLAVGALHAQTVERGEPLVRKGFFGAQLTPAQGGGAVVGRVWTGSTAQAAGLETGDLLLKVNGQDVSSAAALAPLLKGLKVGDSLSLEVKRKGEDKKLSAAYKDRPKQAEEGLEVVYDQVLSKGRRIRVIATHPSGSGPLPTLFLIGGIGAYSVDGTFDAIAYGNIVGPLAKKMATVRIDKPGMGDSEGPAYAELGFDDELDAYVQAIRLAKTLPFVDRDKIVIFGHSMGGAFGPLAAREEKIAGVMACGTMSKTWTEYMLENTRRQSSLAGASPAAVDEELKKLSAACDLLFMRGLSVEEAARQEPGLKDFLKGLSPDGKTYSGVGLTFFHQLAQKNLIGAWLDAGVKTLMMWGENDFISTEWDHQFVADSLNAKTPGLAVFKKLPGSDHGFNKTESFKDSMAKWGRSSTFNPVVLDIMREWLKSSLGIEA